jgi:hypothetical protein
MLQLSRAPEKQVINRSEVGTIWSGSTVVPAKFCGITTGSWPSAREGVASISPAPQFGFGTWRCHDYAPTFNFGVFWRGLHNASGDFTGGTTSAAWEKLDETMDLHRLAGRDIVYSIYGCPSFDVQAAFASSPDMYGGLGGGSPPNTIGTRGIYSNVYVHLFDFVERLVTRYNTETLRSNDGQKAIKFMQTWNEPIFTGYTATSFFYGTASEMALMARTVKLAAQSVDPNIVVTGPSFTGNVAYISQFLNASDTVGGNGRDHVDAVSYHPYYADVPGVRRPRSTSPNLITLNDQIRAAIVAGGLASNTLLYGFEQGTTADASGVDVVWHWPPEIHAQYIRRVSTLQAALGWQSAVWYHYDRNFSGNAARQKAVADALNAVHTQIAGNTLTKIELRDDGSYKVTATSGVFYM